MSDWCVLRTSGPATLPLAETLRTAGIDAWTPTAVYARRRPRSRQRHEIRVALTPTYVFGRANSLSDLSELSGRFRFRLMFDDQGPALVRDSELEALRHAENRAAPKHKPRRALPFSTGETIRVPSGSFQGMDGIVQLSDERDTLVCFGRYAVKIGTWHLREDMAQGDAAIAVWQVAG